MAPDGTFVVTAPDGSDALVDVRTVSEQLLYEIGDPSGYLLPDVTCDWSNVTIDQVGANRVSVSGARGLAPPSTLKACAQIPDGWRAQALLFIGGRDAAAKARRVGANLLERGASMLSRARLGDFEAVSVEVLGAEDTYGPHARTEASREVVLKIAVHHRSREAVAAFVREIPSIALAGPPGVSGGGVGLARPTPLIRLECFPVSRAAIDVVVEVDGTRVEVEPDEWPAAEPKRRVVEESPLVGFDDPTVSMPLLAIAHGRSGDKGGDVNVGIRARHPDLWPILLRELTAERVADHLGHLGAVEVLRYVLRGIHAVNFLLVGGLGAGGTASLRFDPQGKAVAQQLLDIEIAVPVELARHAALRPL